MEVWCRVSFCSFIKRTVGSLPLDGPGQTDAHTTEQSLPGRRAQAPLGVQSRTGSGVTSLLMEGTWPGVRVWAGDGPGYPDFSGNAGVHVVPGFVVTAVALCTQGRLVRP